MLLDHELNKIQRLVFTVIKGMKCSVVARDFSAENRGKYFEDLHFEYNCSDRLQWVPNSTSNHPVKSYYLKEWNQCFNKGRKQFWKPKIHERFKLHLRGMAGGGLPWPKSEDTPCPVRYGFR